MPLMTNITELKRNVSPTLDKLIKSDDDFMFIANGKSKKYHFVILTPDKAMELLGGDLSDKIKVLLDQANKEVSNRSKHLNE